MRLKSGSNVEQNALFITFEGIDFSGKSIQSRLLFQYIKTQYDCVLLRDPGTTKISEKIRAIVLSNENNEMSALTELLLYEAARVQMVQESIMPALNIGKIVICDRFYDSTTAYQGYGRELDLSTVQLANRIGSCALVPDITFLLDVSPETAESRKRSDHQVDRLESQGIKFQHKVRQGYLKIAAQESDRVFIVDGQRDIDTVHHEILNILHSKKRFKL
jgi:dTMP kinase